MMLTEKFNTLSQSWKGKIQQQKPENNPNEEWMNTLIIYLKNRILQSSRNE